MRAFAFGTALAFALANAATASEVTVTYGNNYGDVSVSPGDTLIVKLPGAHNVGYWKLDFDHTPILMLSGRTTESAAAVGAPETTTYVFTTPTVGGITLKASYVNIADKKTTDSFAITVTVAPK